MADRSSLAYLKGLTGDNLSRARVTEAFRRGRIPRHDPRQPDSVRTDPTVIDTDHWLNGNDIAGPQFPLWQRVGAIAPTLAYEAARPLVFSKTPLMVPTPAGPVMLPVHRTGEAINKVMTALGLANKGEKAIDFGGSGVSEAEQAPDLAGTLRNLQMTVRGAMAGPLPEEE